MRFNDLMQTVLAADDRAGLGAVTLWRQCVDLLAQQDRAGRSRMTAVERTQLLDRMAALRPKLSETQRIATVVELGRRLRSVSLVEFFAHDRPSIAAAAIARADLPDAVWADLLPRLNPTARGVLRGRRDIGPTTRLALEAFGSSDLVLTTVRQDMIGDSDMLLTADMATNDVDAGAMVDAPAPVIDPAPAPASAPETAAVTALHPLTRDEDQIRNLVERIARFTSTRQPPASHAPSTDEPSATPSAFAFETDAAGMILWVDQGPRAALIGLSLGEVAIEGGSGPDGHVAGAFARRSGFQNGRFAIVGGAMAGEWRLSATPFFDARSGRFQGFRGQARRPYLHEVAAPPAAAAPLAIHGLPTDSLRQLVHELRTPLNAILGFAEIIEQELFGAAGEAYRDMAGKIAVDARHLLVAFDDLDLAARVSRGEQGGALQRIDPAAMIAQVAARFGDAAGGSPVDIIIAPDLPSLCIDAVQGERMVQHLLRTVISVAPAGEAVTGDCWFQPDPMGKGGAGRVVLALDRPSTLDGMEEAQLLDPGYTADGDWADGPLLGLGFSLRLIRSLAGTCGGSLDVEAERLLLSIPAATDAGDAADIG